MVFARGIRTKQDKPCASKAAKGITIDFNKLSIDLPASERCPSSRGGVPWGTDGSSMSRVVQKKRAFRGNERRVKECFGDDLLSHPVSGAVPLAQMGLTSLFGMGRGVTPSL